VRDFTGLLNILRQNPGESFESLATRLHIEPAGDAADTGRDDADQFAEFEL